MVASSSAGAGAYRPQKVEAADAPGPQSLAAGCSANIPLKTLAESSEEEAIHLEQERRRHG